MSVIQPTLIILLISAVSYAVSRIVFVPIILRIVNATPSQWDRIIFSRRTLNCIATLVPTVIMWRCLPSMYKGILYAETIVDRGLDLLITILCVRLALSILRSVHGLEEKITEDAEDPGDLGKLIHNTHSLQYAHALYGTVRLIVIGIGILVAAAILFDESLTSLFTGIGAGAAVLGVVFKEVILSAIACIRLTQSDLLRPGDWITIEDSGIHGIVEDMSLTTVRIRNFDHTILTIPPRKLMSEPFRNWRGMWEGDGRRVMRELFIDLRSINGDNLTRYREACEAYLAQHPEINHDHSVMVRLMPSTSLGIPMELNFFLTNKEWVPFEHNMALIIEHCLSLAPNFGIRFFQAQSASPHENADPGFTAVTPTSV